MTAATGFCLAIAASVFTADASAAVINNGSFETAATGSTLPGGGGESLVVGSTAMTGWTVTGSNPGHDMIWLTNTNNAFGLSTPFGGYFLDLTGYTDASAYTGVALTIPTAIGGSYHLTFDPGVNQSDSRYDGPIGVMAATGSTTQSFLNDNPSGTGNFWQLFTLNFVASATRTTISITACRATNISGWIMWLSAPSPSLPPGRTCSVAWGWSA